MGFLVVELLGMTEVGVLYLAHMAGRIARASKTNWSIAAVVAIVFVASAFLLFVSAPEQVVGVSDDGLVHASGLTRSSQTLLIDRIDNVETSIQTVVSPVYEISLTGGGSLDGGEIVMVIDASESVSESVFYTFDRETLSWTTLPTLFNLSERTISTSLNLTGSMLIVAGAHE